MRAANLESLKEKIIRPDFDKHLVPLLLYRGANDVRHFGRVHRLFNFAVTMMESEVDNYSEAARLSSSPDFAHLCGPRRPLNYGQFPSFFGRLLDHPRVTNNIPGLTDYVKLVRGAKHRLMPISIYTNDPMRKGRDFAPWRINDYSPEIAAERAAEQQAREDARKGRAAERQRRVEVRKEWLLAAEIAREKKRKERLLAKRSSEPIFYPYLIHKPKDGDSERQLLMAVNNAVPRHLPDWLRSDICQDLIVAILSGEISVDDLKDNVRHFTSKVMKVHPFRYGPLSLDAPLTRDSKTTLGEMLVYGEVETL